MGQDHPPHTEGDRWALGRLCINATDLVDPNAQRLLPLGQVDRVDDLLAQLLPGFELQNPPKLMAAISRSLEYLRIFDQKFPQFHDNKTLEEYFRSQTGIGLGSYLSLVMAVVAHFLNELDRDTFIAELPRSFNVDSEQYFRFLALDDNELTSFFLLVSAPWEQLKNELVRERQQPTQDNFDFTTFRRYPVVFLTDTVFTVVDLAFLVEKVSFGLNRTIHSILPPHESDPQLKNAKAANAFARMWGETVETYVSKILDPLDTYFPDVTFQISKSESEQIDGVFIDGKEAAVVEIKGQFLSAAAKYGGGNLLVKEMNEKFGRKQREKDDRRKGAVHQLAKDIALLYPYESDKQKKIASLSCPNSLLDAESIYPVMIVDEPSLRFNMAQLRLKLWFQDEIRDHKLRTGLYIHPLLILPINLLEDMEPYLHDGSISFLHFCKFYSSRNQDGVPFWECDSETVLRDFLKHAQPAKLRNSRLNARFDEFMKDLGSRLSQDGRDSQV